MIVDHGWWPSFRARQAAPLQARQAAPLQVSFKAKQPALHIEAAAVAAERAVGGDDAVAGDDRRQGIDVQGLADGARRPRLAGLARGPGVRPPLAGGGGGG